MSFVIVYRACRRGVEYQPAIRRNQGLTSFIFSMSVSPITATQFRRLPSFPIQTSPDNLPQLAAPVQVVSGGSSGSGSARKGGALGMPVVSGGRSCGVCWWYSTSNSVSAVYSRGPVPVLSIRYFLIILAFSSLWVLT